MKILFSVCILAVLFLSTGQSRAQAYIKSFRFYYNYPPDSIFINSSLIQLDDKNNFRYDSAGVYKIRGVLNYCDDVFVTATLKKRRIYPVRLTFKLNDNLSQSELSAVGKVLPLKSWFSSTSIASKKNIRNTQFLTLGLLVPVAIVAGSDKDYRTKVMPIPVAGLMQLFYWQWKESGKYDHANKFTGCNNYENKKWRLTADFSTLNPVQIGIDKKETRKTSGMSYTRTIRAFGPGNYTLSLGIDRVFNPDFIAGLSVNYYPTGELKINCDESRKYGTSSLRNIQNYNIHMQFGVINADMNWRVIQFLSQKIFFSLGAYWGTPVEYKKNILFREYITIDSYDTLKFRYKIQPYGFTTGILIDSPLSSKFSFNFRMRVFCPITTYVFDDKKLNFLPTWHAGIAYKF